MSLNKQKKYPPDGVSTIHRADWVLVDPENLIKNGFVKTESDKIVDVGQGRAHGASDQIIDYGTGVLMPGLVNAHTHLELSALKNKTDSASGFIAWVKSVIEKREQTGDSDLRQGVIQAIHELTASGTLIIGEIASLGLSRQPFFDSKLSGVWFKEYLGGDTNALVECKKFDAYKTISVAGHAPHTTASDLLVKLKSVAGKLSLPFSLHLAESREEVEFITTGKGPWTDFLDQRQLDTSFIQLTGAGPVTYADQLGLLDASTLAVHLVFAEKKDIRLLAEKNVNVCLCPRSNQILHGNLPDVPLMQRSGLKLCLGTDSLASNNSLSLLDEMKFLSETFSGLSPKDMITMATINGAAALGFEKQFGQLTPGRTAKIIFLPVKAGNPASVLESILSMNFAGQVQAV